MVSVPFRAVGTLAHNIYIMHLLYKYTQTFGLGSSQEAIICEWVRNSVYEPENLAENLEGTCVHYRYMLEEMAKSAHKSLSLEKCSHTVHQWNCRLENVYIYICGNICGSV